MTPVDPIAQLTFQSSLTIMAIVAGWFFAVYGQIRAADSDERKSKLYPLFRSVGAALMLMGGLALVSWFALLGVEWCIKALYVILPVGCGLLMLVALVLLFKSRD
jgi:hypothetical protein